jgi:ATP-dependent DNA helicase RecQ
MNKNTRRSYMSYIKERLDELLKNYDVLVLEKTENLEHENLVEFDELDMGKITELSKKEKMILKQEKFQEIYKNVKMILNNKEICYVQDGKSVSGLLDLEGIEINTEKMYKDIEIKEIETEEELINILKQENTYIPNIEKLKDFMDYNQIEKRYLPNKIENKKEINIVTNKGLSIENIKKFYNTSKVKIINIYDYPKDILNSEIKKIDWEGYLKDNFGYDNFKTFKIYKNNSEKEKMEVSQKDIIQYVWNELFYSKSKIKDLMFIASTGSGKSLIFQYLAKKIYDETKNITIVIEPLKTLMEDQVDYLKGKFGDFVAKINSGTTKNEREEIYQNIKNEKTSLIYVSPEFLASNNISRIIGDRKISMFVIDEAHVVSGWGNTFRADYGYLGDYIKDLKENTAERYINLVLTATAINGGELDTLKEISNYLSLRNPEIIITNYRRDNINFEINNLEKDSKEDDLYDKIVEHLKNNIENNKKTIVYCPYKSHVDEFREKIDFDKIEYIYGNIKKENKEIIQRRFKNGKIKAIIATKAFGMGIDVPDVREVIHFKLPNNLIDYTQEIGRAGRDGQESKAIVYYNPKLSHGDSFKLEKMSIPRKWQLYKIYEILKNKTIKNNLNGNFTVSLDDFTHLFDDQKDEIKKQKIRTSLFLVEKEIQKNMKRKVLYKNYEGLRYIYFGVIKTKEEEIIQKIPQAYKVTEKIDSDLNITGDKIKTSFSIFKLDVAGFLETNHPDVIIRKFIYDFFNNGKEKYFGMEVVPFTRFGMKTKDMDLAKDRLERIIVFFYKMHHSSEYFYTMNNKIIINKELNDKIREYINTNIEDLNWLKMNRREIYSKLINIYNILYKPKTKNMSNEDINPFSIFYINQYGKMVKSSRSIGNVNNQIKNLINKLPNKHKITLFRNSEQILSSPIVTFGKILEILDLAEIEYSGGESGLIEYKFTKKLPENIRITKDKILKDRADKENKTMKEFFGKEMTDKERWDFIENYFLAI